MHETIRYPYSKNSAILGVLLPLIFFAITFNNLYYSYLSGYTINWLVIAFADLVFLSLFVFVLIKRLTPALRKEVALELNSQGITDYTRNIVIEWGEVKNISMERGRSSSKMVVDLKEETDYGKQIAISLRWIAGKDLEICQTTQAYFEEMTRLN
jgi:hypothetical protein